MSSDCKGNPLEKGDVVYVFTLTVNNTFSGQLGRAVWISETTVRVSPRLSTSEYFFEETWPCVYARVLKIPPNLIEAGNIDTIKGYIRLAGIDTSEFSPDNYRLKLPGLEAPSKPSPKVP